MFNLEDEGQDVEEEETEDDMDGSNGKIEWEQLIFLVFFSFYFRFLFWSK